MRDHLVWGLKFKLPSEPIDLTGDEPMTGGGGFLGFGSSTCGVKAASDIVAPVDGEIVQVNEALADNPGMVNEDPTGNGWFFKMKAADASQMDDYMDEAAYKDMIG